MRYYGETVCDSPKRPCRNKAYYQVGRICLCGVHSKRFKGTRQALPVNPNKAQERLELLRIRQQRVEDAAAENRAQGRPGQLMLSKLSMMREPAHHDGFLKVFPNFKHQHRKDGFGCKALSPKDLGPIHHPQPHLPPALNLENFHQGNKVFASELDETKAHPSAAFFDTQRRMYESPIPLRHKPQALEQKGNKNIPCFSVWMDASRTLHKLTYLQSRQFYCTYYQRLVEPLPDFRQLVDWLRTGYNLQLVGYDAYQPVAITNSMIPIAQTMEACYLDARRPFGHELVLYALLAHHVYRLDCLPWLKYKTFEF